MLGGRGAYVLGERLRPLYIGGKEGSVRNVSRRYGSTRLAFRPPRAREGAGGRQVPLGR